MTDSEKAVKYERLTRALTVLAKRQGGEGVIVDAVGIYANGYLPVLALHDGTQESIADAVIGTAQEEH